MAEADLDELAQRAAGGDDQAFRQLVEATTALIFRLLTRLLGSRADAEDGVQDTFIKAYEALRRNKLERGAQVDAWLCRIAVNVGLDSLRRRRSRRPAPDTVLATLAANDAPAEAIVAIRELSELLDRLPEAQRVALILTQLQGMTVPEVAVALGCSEGAVEQRIVRARAALRGSTDGN